MPVSSGRCLSSAENASSPPADAPMPTIGNDPPARDVVARVGGAFSRRGATRDHHGSSSSGFSVGKVQPTWPTEAWPDRRPSIGLPSANSPHPEDDENHGSSRPPNTAGRSQVLMSRPPPGSATTAFRTGPERCGATLQPARRGILAFFKPLTIWTLLEPRLRRVTSALACSRVRFRQSVRRLRSEYRQKSYGSGGVGCRPDRRFGVLIYRRLRSSFG